MSAAPTGKVYIVLLNWNGWRDTLECLESVFRSGYNDLQVVVCDNDSQDGSLERIAAWAEGRQAAPLTEAPGLRALTSPPVAKPIAYVRYDRASAEAGGDARADGARLVLVQTGANLGFAGGNNVALRFACARDDFAYAWLLNNDTVVAPDALAALVRRLQAEPRAGLCGSTLLHYRTPGTVQAYGGVAYNRWWATMRPLGRGCPAAAPPDAAAVERELAYVAGASILVRREFLRAVGLLGESYFLFYEELDWAARARGRFTQVYAPDSLVYHKEGSTIGAGVGSDAAFHRADFYAHRNRLRFTRRFFPLALPTVALRTLLAAAARLWRRQPRRAWAITRLVVSPETYTWPAREEARPAGPTGPVAPGHTA